MRGERNTPDEDSKAYLEVPVADPHRVTIADSVHELMKEPAGHIFLESSLLLQQVKQLPAIDIVHNQIQLCGRRKHLPQVHDMAVVEALEDGNLCGRQKVGKKKAKKHAMPGKARRQKGVGAGLARVPTTQTVSIMRDTQMQPRVGVDVPLPVPPEAAPPTPPPRPSTP